MTRNPEPTRGEVYMVRSWIVAILAIIICLPGALWSAVWDFIKLLWSGVWGSVKWFFGKGYIHLIWLALAWHLISTMEVNKVQSAEQYNAVKLGCERLSKNNPSVFKWDGSKCVYPGGE